MKLRLPQQPLRLLSVLVEFPGEIVTREQLRQRLWPSDVFIDFDHGLNKSIQKLREALGDSADSPRYIETVPRVGYRFIAPVRPGARPPEPGVAVEIPAPPIISVPPLPTRVAANPSVRQRFSVSAAAMVLCTAAAIALYFGLRVRPAVPKYTQLTDFTDSATTPALSPDGHILAFIRGERAFMSTGDIYVKILPDGEPTRLTHDPRLKYNLAFSPDGAQIAYTVMEEPNFATYTIPVLGGDPQLLLKNAAGLTWEDQNHLLFSRIRSGLHMGIVTQSIPGDGVREIYFPAHERGMAHYSFASPDRRSALVVEMNGQGGWAGCKLISLAGAFPAVPAGPQGECTAAGWSPDGSWMYFIATVEGESHLWRQRSPHSSPEQITIGPSQDEGLAVEKSGRSIITSVGEHQSSIWIHDDAGERSLSSEGEIVDDTSPPSFAEGDSVLYYLLRHQADASPELRRLTLATGRSEAVLPGTSMTAYDVSPDGKRVVYTSVGHDGRSRLWLASMDRSSPARKIGDSGEAAPHFGPQGKILFQMTEGNANYVEEMNPDGSARAKVVPNPIIELQGVSPGRKWLTAIAAYPENNSMIPMVVAIPLDGGPSRRLCTRYCFPEWSSNGQLLLVQVEAPSQGSPGRSITIPLGPGESLPELPPAGIPAGAGPGLVPGSRSVSRAGLVPGKDLSHYAYVNTTVHHNLYRISLP